MVLGDNTKYDYFFDAEVEIVLWAVARKNKKIARVV